MSGPQENVFGNFVLLHLIRPEIIITGSVPVHIGSSADMCKKVVDHVFINTAGYSAEFYGWTAKTAKIGTLIRQIPYTFHIIMLEDEIQKPRISCFTVCALVFGGTALESASDDGWWIPVHQDRKIASDCVNSTPTARHFFLCTVVLLLRSLVAVLLS